MSNYPIFALSYNRDGFMIIFVENTLVPKCISGNAFGFEGGDGYGFGIGSGNGGYCHISTKGYGSGVGTGDGEGSSYGSGIGYQTLNFREELLGNGGELI